jgi:hypothetical protein
MISFSLEYVVEEKAFFFDVFGMCDFFVIQFLQFVFVVTNHGTESRIGPYEIPVRVKVSQPDRGLRKYILEEDLVLILGQDGTGG